VSFMMYFARLGRGRDITQKRFDLPLDPLSRTRLDKVNHIPSLHRRVKWAGRADVTIALVVTVAVTVVDRQQQPCS